jgi:flagellar biogenesis protein FliO
LLTGLAVLLAPSIAFADTPLGEPPGGGMPGGEVPWARAVWATLLVVGLICLGVYVLKKLNGQTLFGRSRYMQVLEGCNVGGKVHLFLVRVAGRVVLLGTSGEGLTRLAEFDEGDLPEPETSPAGTDEGFKTLISRLVGARQ